MIVRAILETSNMPFDYFNDFDDTMRWLRGVKTPRSVIARAALINGQKKWYAEWRQKMN